MLQSCFKIALCQAQIKELVEDICKVRMSKICAGLQVLQGPMTVKLNNLSAMECNVVRPFFQGSLGQFQALASVGAVDAASLFPLQMLCAESECICKQPV